MPTGIGTDKKDMQNLAEMLYAICYPDKWYENATNYHTDGKYWGYTGMPIFNDWTKANLMYHNQYFWQKVAKAWKSKDIPGKAMNVDFAMLDKMTKPEGGDGVKLLYKGYSWWTKTSWNCTLYQASFTHGTKNTQKNLHHAEYKDLKRNMKDIDGFNCLKMGAKTENYAQFFGNDGKIRWVARFATGEELNGGTKPAPTAQLQGGCRDVYRYYDEYKTEWDQKGPNGEDGPEVTLKPAEKLQEPKIGAIIGTDGNFYNNMADAKRATNGEDAVGIVVCLNGDRRVEKGQDWNGLAILLKSVEGKTFGVSYGNCDDEARMYDGINDKMGYTEKNVNGHRERFYLADELNGLYYTQYYSNGCGKGHRHPVAQACNYDVFPNNAAFSKAFMPSAGQFILAMKGLGIGWDLMHGFHNTAWSGRDAAEEAEQLEHAKAILQDSGCGISDKDIFLTTTQANDYSQVAFQFNYEMRANGLYFVEWSLPIATRPFIAFKYNGGATED